MSKRMFCAALALGLIIGGLGAVDKAEARTRRAVSSSTSIACLTPAARALWWRIKSRFPNVFPTSTCRPGARVRGTGGVSRHAQGNAIDFNAHGNKRAVVAWLIANHFGGGTMTYVSSGHIHADIGPHWASLAGRKLALGAKASKSKVAFQSAKHRQRKKVSVSR